MNVLANFTEEELENYLLLKRSKASTSQAKASTSQVKASTSQAKASTSQVKASTSQVKASTSQVKASTSQVKASTSQVKSLFKPQNNRTTFTNTNSKKLNANQVMNQKLFETSTPNKKRLRKSNESSYDEEKDTHVVVFWIEENKYSLVAIGDVQDDEVVEDRVYSVLFKNKPYQARVVFIGNEDQCEDVLIERSNELVSKSKAAKQLDKMTTHRAKISEIQTEQQNDHELVCQELEVLRKKLLEVEEANKEDMVRIEKLTDENKRLQDECEQFKQTFSIDDQAKYLKWCITFVDLFGEKQDKAKYNNQIARTNFVPLVDSHPQQRVMPALLAEVNRLVGVDEPSKIVRKCLVALLPEDVIQAVINDNHKMYTGKKLYDNYRDEFNAIKDFLAVNNLPSKDADIKRYANNFRSDLKRGKNKSANNTMLTVDPHGNAEESLGEMENGEMSDNEIMLELDDEDDENDHDI